MLAESVKQWTREWKREGMQKGLKKGRQEGLEQGLQVTRDLLLSQMTNRFDPLPPKIRRKIQDIKGAEELKNLGNRLLVASSLDDLGL